MQLISVFENDTITLSFDYVEALGDGRGYTCGLGFTTGTGDAYEVVNAYTTTVPQQPAGDVPAAPEAARRRRQRLDDRAHRLPGGVDAGGRRRQVPATRRSRRPTPSATCPRSRTPRRWACKSALAITAVYDTVWMHGDGDDPDGAPALIAKASAQVSAASDEAGWLKAFLAVRRADLLNPADSTTQAEWSMAVGRVDEFSDLLAAGNLALSGPIAVTHGYDVTVP